MHARRVKLKSVLVNLAIFHDQIEIVIRIGDQVDVFEWIAVNQDEISIILENYLTVGDACDGFIRVSIACMDAAAT